MPEISERCQDWIKKFCCRVLGIGIFSKSNMCCSQNSANSNMLIFVKEVKLKKQCTNSGSFFPYVQIPWILYPYHQRKGCHWHLKTTLKKVGFYFSLVWKFCENITCYKSGTEKTIWVPDGIQRMISRMYHSGALNTLSCNRLLRFIIMSRTCCILQASKLSCWSLHCSMQDVCHNCEPMAQLTKYLSKSQSGWYPTGIWTWVQIPLGTQVFYGWHACSTYLNILSLV